MPQRLALVWMLVLGVHGAQLPAADLKPQSRVEILRSLMAEYGTLQAPLPRGDKGLRLQSTGDVDREKLLHEITQNGTALKSGTVVQITQIQFKDKEIIFEINGGGKSKTKWYERIEVGVGTRTTPINDPNARVSAEAGSSITLVFPSKLPDLTPDELKDYLSPVLDLDAKIPTLGPAEEVPPEFQKAIEEKRAVAGMSQDMVRAAMGSPDRTIREEKDGVEQEDWVYEAPPMKVVFVTFEADKVVDVQEHHGGVRGETVPYPAEPPR